MGSDSSQAAIPSILRELCRVDDKQTGADDCLLLF
jgi:hypothetical protein